jgi:hypothetical protein
VTILLLLLSGKRRITDLSFEVETREIIDGHLTNIEYLICNLHYFKDCDTSENKTDCLAGWEK